MDPQELERVAENIGKIIDQGGPESHVLQYLQSEGFDSRDAWLAAYETRRNANAPGAAIPGGGPSIGPSGPTAQPAFPTLPPLAGGALDMLIQFGLQGTTFGLAGKLIPGVGEASREIDARAPRTSMGMKAAGAAMALPMAAASATVGRAGVGAASALARTKLALGAGAGGGAVGTYALLKRLGVIP